MRVRKEGPLRAVAVTRVLDEADIVEAFVRHTATYVHHHVLIDNGSSDGTLSILQQLRAEGLPMTIYGDRSVSYVEEASNGFLFHDATDHHDADWVLFLDADEFIDDRHAGDGLIGTLTRLNGDGEQPRGLLIPVFNYMPTTVDDRAERLIPKGMCHRFAESMSSHVALPASLADREISIASGAHSALIDTGPVRCHSEPGLAIAHYPIRNAYQSAAKSFKGWAKVLAAGPQEVARGTSYHYKALFDHLRNNPEYLFLNEAFLRCAFEPADMHLDPIDYKGGALRYTSDVNHAMRAVRGLVRYVEGLATEFGEIMEQIPEAKAMIAARNAKFETL